MTRRQKRLIAVLLALALVQMAAANVTAGAKALTLRQGDRSETVKTMQEKLKRWGYYSGQADGIFGSATVEAVRKFQKKNGLTADGVVGEATLRALGMESGGTSGGTALQEHDVALLARVISAEARGEPYEGQVAVGAVILNRIAHPAFPNTLAGVVYQAGAFSCMLDGQINAEVTASARAAAREALGGADPSGGAVYYFNPDTATSSWIWSRPLICVIGKHRFCA